jgi:uncharacterized protein YqhQ
MYNNGYGIRERMCSDMKPSGVGGQAVIEGVMMKNKETYATAVRKPDNEIVIEKGTYISISDKIKLFKLPIFRGILSFAESMIIGTKTLTFSSSFYEEEEEVKQTKVETAFSKVFKEKAEAVVTGITFFVSILLAIGLFIVLPRFIANLLEKQINSDIILTVIEGCVRILIFIAYIIAISQIKDIKRMFMYHGAEHKTINCIENGYELTVENVKKQSKQHKRCGTSFIFIVMFVSILFFLFIRVDQEWMRYLIRILLIPVIAGVSYEFIRFAGRSDSLVANILSKPGLWLQGLTTREPDNDMIEVAIQSVEAVFDWREFQEKNQNSRKAAKSKTSKSNAVKENNKVSSGSLKEKSKMDSSKNQDNIASKNSDTDNINIEGTVVEKNSSGKQQKKSSNKKPTSKDTKNVIDEIAATVEKSPVVAPKSIFDEEEDDEILRALDRYLTDDENNTDKE